MILENEVLHEAKNDFLKFISTLFNKDFFLYFFITGQRVYFIYTLFRTFKKNPTKKSFILLFQRLCHGYLISEIPMGFLAWRNSFSRFDDLPYSFLSLFLPSIFSVLRHIKSSFSGKHTMILINKWFTSSFSDFSTRDLIFYLYRYDIWLYLS